MQIFGLDEVDIKSDEVPLLQKENKGEIDYTSQRLQGHHFSPVLLKQENDGHDR